jgi:hypothetical protein
MHVVRLRLRSSGTTRLANILEYPQELVDLVPAAQVGEQSAEDGAVLDRHCIFLNRAWLRWKFSEHDEAGMSVRAGMYGNRMPSHVNEKQTAVVRNPVFQWFALYYRLTAERV